MSKKIISYILIATLSFTLGWQGAQYDEDGVKTAPKSDITTPTTTTDTVFSKDLKQFWRVWELLQERYVDPTVIDDQNRLYGAIRGMVSSLKDPYTVFMDPNETKQFAASLEGTLEGIGAELTIESGNLTIVSPLKGSPAEKAGLLAKDIIYKVNEEVTADMTLFEAISKIRGEKGTTVTLSIIRKGLTRPLDVTITRAAIDVPSVTFEMKNESTAYISINQFSEKTTVEFNKARQELMLKNPTGLILDLRNNGGGYLDGAVDILSEFLPGDKRAVVIKKRQAEDNEILYTSGKPHWETIPLVVLVNEGTASASEIVAGGIQDHKRGLIIGGQTFGKGSVQEINSLEDGSSLRITVAKWHTPLDRDIGKVGVTPDRVIKMTDEDYEKDRDPQLEEAIQYLKEYNS